MMKKFEYPEMEIDVFEVEDIITTSSTDESGPAESGPATGEDQLPYL